jgi:hypothetical protein
VSVKVILLIAVLVTLTAEVHAETSILRSLPTAAQKKIENIRAECRGADLKSTSDDEGLSLFTLSGVQAAMVDELNFCDGGQCHHGINRATGYSHWIEGYVRSGNAWRMTLSTNVMGVPPALPGWQ